MEFTIERNRLKGITYKQTPNTSRGTLRPLYLVMHYTASTSASGASSWLRNKKARASAHVVIGRTLEDTTQLAEFDQIAWHAGRSYYQGVSGLNRHSIGLEIVNAGVLEQRGDGHWYTYYGQRIPDEEVVVTRHEHGGPQRGWHAFTKTQLNLVEDITRAILQAYSTIKEIVGHDDISWPRKTDPGPAFPKDRFRGLISTRSLGADDDYDGDDLFRVTVNSSLNLRGGPSTSYSVEAALSNGVQVIVRDESKDPWWFVEVSEGHHQGKTGFVYKNFLRRV